jgi:hypothetical protein
MKDQVRSSIGIYKPSFGSEYALWAYCEEPQITLYADLGNFDLWKYDSAALTRIAPENPDEITASASLLYADCGVYGIWKYDGNSWTLLAPENSEELAVGY